MSGASFGDLLLPATVQAMARQWLQEDVPSFDYGGFVVGDKAEVAHLFGKSHGVLAGVPFFDAVFAELGCRVEWKLPEGSLVVPTAKPSPPRLVATVHGPARMLLLGERVALNVLARASGIATKCAQVVAIKHAAGWHGMVAGTRKTTPGLRLVEKHAMMVGGADAHRFDLSSMVMLKDNHIWSQGSIASAVQKARLVAGFSLKIEVECGSVADAEEAIVAGAHVIMFVFGFRLDNLEADAFKAAAATLKGKHPHILIEGSGGITAATIAAFMSPDVDILSTSSVHQGVPHVDFSLKIAH